MSDFNDYLDRAGLDPIEDDSLKLDTTVGTRETTEPISVTPDPLDPYLERAGLPTSPMYTRKSPGAEAKSNLHKTIAEAEDPVAFINRLNASSYIADELDMDQAYVFENLEAISNEWLGKQVPPRSLAQNIVAATRIGKANYEIGKLAYNLVQGTADEDEVFAQIARIEKDMPQLGEMPKNWIHNALIWFAESAPAMSAAWTAGAAGGAVVGGTAGLLMNANPAGALGAVASGGLSVPALTLAMTAAGGAIGAAVESTQFMAGLQYYDLRKRGVSPEIAKPIAMGAGAISGAIETAQVSALFPKVPGLMQTAGGIAESVAKKMMGTGFISRVGVKMAADFIGTGIEEGIEEGLQEIVAVGAEQLARELSENQKIAVNIEKATIDEIAKRTMQAAWQGFSASLVGGGPRVLQSGAADVRVMNAIQQAAPLHENKEEFVDALSETFAESRPAGMTDTEFRNQVAEQWDAAHQEQTQPQEGDVETPAAPSEEYRTETGGLYTEDTFIAPTREGGTAILKAGDPTTGERYGYVQYEVINDKVYVEDIVNETETDNRRELILDLAARYPGLEIEWNPVDEIETDIHETLVETNPRGPEYGLQWFDADEQPITDTTDTTIDQPGEQTARATPEQAAENRVRTLTADRFKKKLVEGFGISTDEADYFHRFNEIFASNEGVTVDEWLNKYFDAEVFTSDQERQNLLNRNQATAAVGFRAGNEYVDPLQVDKEEYVGQVRAVFTAIEGSNFHDAVHEYFHVFERLAANEEQIKKFEDALGKMRSAWTTKDVETLATRFEEYLATGQSPIQGLADVFEKIAATLKSLVSFITEHPTLKLSPEFKEAYDAMFQDPNSGLSRATEINPDDVMVQTRSGEPRRYGDILQEQRDRIRSLHDARMKALEEQERSIDEERDAVPMFHQRDNQPGRQRVTYDKNATKELKPLQQTADFDEIMRLSEEALPALNEYSEAIAEQYGSKVSYRPVSEKTGKRLKERDRAARKITPQEGPEHILDIAGNTIIAPDLPTLFRIMDDLVDRDEVVRVKDRYQKPVDGGYRDMLMNIRMPNGVIVELQVNVENMMEAKKPGHVFYEIKDQVDKAWKKDQISDEVYEGVNEWCDRGMEFVYGNAFEATLSGAIASASSREIGWALGPISTQLQESGAGLSVLSEKTRNKLATFTASGLSSQSRNLNLGSSIEGTFTESPSTTNIVQPEENIKDSGALFHTAPPVDSEAFREWFGDSKVVDEKGKPLRVYHGTEVIDIEEFDPGYIARNYDIPGGFHFTSDYDTAELYGSEIYEVYLKIKDPLIYDLDEQKGKIFEEKPGDQTGNHSSASFYDTFYEELIEEAEDNGNDGIVIRDREGELQYVVFSPEQIKSVYNQGTWNPEDPRLLYHDKKNSADETFGTVAGRTITDIEIQDAKGFDSWEEYRDFTEAMADPTEEDTLTPEQKDEYYQTVWEKAQETPLLTREEANENFLEMLRANNFEGLKDFLIMAGQESKAKIAKTPKHLKGGKYAKKRKGPGIGGFFNSAAGRLLAGKEVSDQMLRSLMTTITKDPERYRIDYAEITQDEGMIRQLQHEQETEPALPDFKEIETPEVTTDETMTPDEKMEMVEGIEDPELLQKVADGTLTDSDIEAQDQATQDTLRDLREKQTQEQADERELINKLDTDDQQIVVLQDQLDDVNERLDEMRGRLSAETAAKHGARQRYLEEINEAREQIEALEAELDGFGEQKQAFREALSSARKEARAEKAEAVKGVTEPVRQKLAAEHEALISARAEHRLTVRMIHQKERERRAIQRMRDYKMRLAKYIRQPPAKTIDFEYAEMLRQIARTVDPHFRSEKTTFRKEFSRRFFDNNPEIAMLLDTKTWEDIQSKSLDQWTVEELEEIAETVKELSKLGRMKRSLKLKQERTYRNKMRARVKATVLQGRPVETAVGVTKETPVFVKAMIPTVKPDRMMKILDNAKDEGVFQDLLRGYNENWNNMQREMNRRQEKVVKAMEELKFTADPLDTRIRTKGFTWLGTQMDIGGFRYTHGDFKGKRPTIEQVMFWYAGIGNKRTRHALMNGNNLPLAVITQGIQQLPAEAKKLADLIQADFEESFPRLREAFIETYNVDLPGEDNYVPMQHTEFNYDDRGSDVAKELIARNGEGLSKEFVKRNPTFERIDIGAYWQTPIKTELFSLWLKNVQTTEGFIHLDQHVKRMHSILEDPATRAAISQRYGTAMNKWLKKYTNDLARQDIYAVSTSADRFQKAIRNNLAVAYLSFNLSSAAKNLVSIFPYLADAGPHRLVSAAGQYMTGRFKGDVKKNELLEFVRDRSELVKNRSISAEFELLRKMDKTAYEQIVKKIGTAGFKLFEVIDIVSISIGWKAVYDKEMARTGGDEQAAIRAADESTVRGQPSGRVQDLAEIYRSGEILRWMTMFTNALNSLWNIAAVDIGYLTVKRLQSNDIPSGVKWKQILHATGDIAALMASGVGIAMASGAIDPDKDKEEREKEWKKGLWAQFTDSIPFIGSDMTALIAGDGYMGQGVKFFPAMENLKRARGKIENDDIAGAVQTMIEGAGYTLGLPTTAARRVQNALESGDPGDLLGWR